MSQVITSKEEFEKKVHCSNGGMLLLFHSSSSSQSDLNHYVEEAEKKCGSEFSVYTINIEDVTLSHVDVDKYQSDEEVICCAVLMDDSVTYKEVNPDTARLWLSISC